MRFVESLEKPLGRVWNSAVPERFQVSLEEERRPSDLDLERPAQAPNPVSSIAGPLVDSPLHGEAPAPVQRQALEQVLEAALQQVKPVLQPPAPRNAARAAQL